MKITFEQQEVSTKGLGVFFVSDKGKLGEGLKKLDKRLNGAISKAIEAKSFKKEFGSKITVPACDKCTEASFLVVCFGKTKKFDMHQAKKLGAMIASCANQMKYSEVACSIDKEMEQKDGSVAASLAMGMELKNYAFNKYFSEESFAPISIVLHSAKIACTDPKQATSEYKELHAVVQGVYQTRDLVFEPANVLFPKAYAKLCEQLKDTGLEIEVLQEDQLKKLSMGALLGVAQGSAHAPCVVVLKWNGDKSSKKEPVAFVGKGVTFDTGGISLKPANGMEEMKTDMGGSAVVVGLMKALALRKAKVNAVGVIGLVENMPGSNAQRPGDVVTTMSGKTVEVINTDAEGRLVLADVLWYTQDRFKPRYMINLATLTGAVVIALGTEYAAIMSNHDGLAEKLTKVSEVTKEKLWRLPLGEGYKKLTKSHIADMTNVGSDRGAGSIVAGQFLEFYVNDTPWAHLDIAGVTWAKKDTDLSPKGATAFGVRLLNEFVKQHCEK